jgi:hypothetical protein
MSETTGGQNPATGNSGGAQADAGRGQGSFLTGSNGGEASKGQLEGASKEADTASSGTASQAETQASQSQASADSAQGAKSGQAQLPPWAAQLPKDLQTDESTTRFATIGDLWKSYRELEGKIGSSIALPGKDAKPEDWAAFWEKCGRPKNPGEYALQKIKDLPQGLEYGDDAGYRARAHALGLTKEQAEGMYAFINEDTLARYKDLVQAQQRKAEETELSLRKEWGKDFEAKYESMRRAVTTFGNEEVLSLFGQTGLTNDPRIARMFAKIGEALGEGAFVEDDGSISASSGERRFSYGNKQ